MAAAARLGEAMKRAAAAFFAGRLDEASALCDAILRDDPGHFYALHLSATLALRRADWEAAVAFASRALRVKPGDAEVLANRGAALRVLGRYDEALADYAAALAAAPGAIHVRHNRGVALAAMGRHEQALAEYEQVLAVAPQSAEALLNCGLSLAALNRHAEAEKCYSRAVDAEPGHVRARWNRALSRLAMGDFAGGFSDYEARHLLEDRRAATRSVAGPSWNGREPLQGKTVLLLAEQGFGDCIQFSRFARLLHERGARVFLEAPAPVASLLAQLPYFEAVIPTGSPVPSFDLHCPLASLPALLGTRLEDLPSQDQPIQAPRASLERWNRRLEGVPRPRVGIAWSGGLGNASRDPRSIPLEALGPVRELPASFVALQKMIPDADRAGLHQPSPLLHFEDAIEDFRDTAALAALVDGVVTIDTAVAHLSGAMGRPAWILLPFAADWRWLLDREDSPWYPSARLVRQSRAGDWTTAIERVARDLRDWLGRAPSP